MKLRNIRTSWPLVAALVLAGACEGTEPNADSDVQNHRECDGLVTNWGQIPWGDEGISATYENDFETSRFYVDVQTPSQFRIEVTQKGTNRHLDLVMAVYDPDGNKVGSDDDSGWGRYPRIDIDAEVAGRYEVRVDPKLPDTEDGGELELVRGKYRVALTCLSELCDVDAARSFEQADVSDELESLLDTTEDLEPECEPIPDSEFEICITQSAYGVRYTFNAELAPDLEEAADLVATEEYARGYVGTSYDRDDFASDLADFELSVDDVDATIGYSDYQVASLEIDSDCSPDHCWGRWWFLHAPERGEIHAIQLGYYESPTW